jgi:hypothetical protein
VKGFFMLTKNTLPLMCYASLTDGETVAIHYGENGYFKNTLWVGEQRDVAELNEAIGVTKEQADVMIGGSMFGLNIPLVTDYLEGR